MGGLNCVCVSVLIHISPIHICIAGVNTEMKVDRGTGRRKQVVPTTPKRRSFGKNIEFQLFITQNTQ